jgi:hypothetical protein
MSLADHTPAAADRSPRERMIRDLYALIAFYAAHPHIPVPELIVATHQLASQEQIAALGAILDEQPYGGHRMLSHRVPGTDGRIDLHFQAAGS